MTQPVGVLSKRIFTASFTGIAVSVAQDIFEITAPAGATARICSAHFGQSSDYGDAAAEGLRLRWVRGDGATSGSGGSLVTPVPHMVGILASRMIVERNNTTIMTAGGGTLTTLRSEAFNVQAGYFYLPVINDIFDERWEIGRSDRLTLELIANPVDEITAEGYITWEEFNFV